MLYQLSYSRVPSANLTAQWGSLYRPRPLPPPCRPCRPSSGGEGDRTPDLVNAIHALSHLSYAPDTYCPASERHRGKHGNVSRARKCVNEAPWPATTANRADEG